LLAANLISSALTHSNIACYKRDLFRSTVRQFAAQADCLAVFFDPIGDCIKNWRNGAIFLGVVAHNILCSRRLISAVAIARQPAHSCERAN
jgi:hypothetical protein